MQGNTRARRRALIITVVALATTGLAACTGATAGSGGDPSNASVTQLTGTVSVWHPVPAQELPTKKYPTAADQQPEPTTDTELTMLDTIGHGRVLLDVANVPLGIPDGSVLSVKGQLSRDGKSFKLASITGLHRAAAAPGAAAALTAPGPATMLIIPFWCSTSGTQPASPTPTDYVNLVTNVVSPWFGRQSNANRTFVPVSTPWLDQCATGTMITPEEAAVTAGWSPSTFDRVVMVDAASNPFFLGVAENIPGRRLVIAAGMTDPGLWAHELGHLEGLFHANRESCIASNSSTPTIYDVHGTCDQLQYGDFTDAMGIDDPSPPTVPILRPFSAGQRQSRGWLTPSQLTTVTANGTYVIRSISDPNATGPVAIELPLASGTYYLEYRTPVGDDAWMATRPGLSNGIQLRVRGAVTQSGGLVETEHDNLSLLDGRPATPTFDDAALPWGTSWETSQEGVTISAANLGGGQVGVTVTYQPNYTAPSVPRNVRAVYDPITNTAQVNWDAPLLQAGGMFYIVSPTPLGAPDPNTGWPTGSIGTYATVTSMTIGGFSDGFSAVAVTAASIGAGTASVFGSSEHFWVQRRPTASPVTVAEGTGVQGVAIVPFSVPWSNPGTATFLFVGDGGTATLGPDWTVPGGGTALLGQVNGGATTGLFGFNLVGDSVAEPNETVAISYLDNICPGWVPGCQVHQPLTTVTITNDD